MLVDVVAFGTPKTDFLLDVDGQGVSLSRYRVCALQQTPGIDLGGRVRCWSAREEAEDPPDDIFVQVISLLHYSCGLTVDGEVICWGESEYKPKTVEGSWKQISADSASTFFCGVLMDSSIQCIGTHLDFAAFIRYLWMVLMGRYFQYRSKCAYREEVCASELLGGALLCTRSRRYLLPLVVLLRSMSINVMDRIPSLLGRENLQRSPSSYPHLC